MTIINFFSIYIFFSKKKNWSTSSFLAKKRETSIFPVIEVNQNWIINFQLCWQSLNVYIRTRCWHLSKKKKRRKKNGRKIFHGISLKGTYLLFFLILFLVLFCATHCCCEKSRRIVSRLNLYISFLFTKYFTNTIARV